MEYKDAQILDLKDRNPIWEIIADDSREITLKRKNDGYLCLTAEDMLDQNKSWGYMADAMKVAKALNLTFTEVYETWDLVKLYEYLTVILYNEYEELPPDGNN